MANRSAIHILSHVLPILCVIRDTPLLANLKKGWRDSEWPGAQLTKRLGLALAFLSSELPPGFGLDIEPSVAPSVTYGRG